MASRIINSRYLLWILLAIPAVPFLDDFINPSRYYPEMMQSSGILSIQFLVATLCITPITLVLKPIKWGRAVARWLLPRRKYFGLAAAAYALIHTVLYLRYISWDWHLAVLEGLEWPFATGWIAMFLFLLVAAVSNQTGIKRLGPYWKPVQRLSYAIAVFALLHWLLLDVFIDDPLVWIIPLAAAKLLHIVLRVNQKFSISGNSGTPLVK